MNGVNGFVCNVRDIDDLIRKVEIFIQLPYEQKVKMGKEARKIVERDFDRNKVIDLYLKEIKSH